MLPKVDPKDNAAPYYIKLSKADKMPATDFTKLAQQTLWDTSQANIIAAQEALTRVEKRLELIDSAIGLPHCRFDYGWSSLSGGLPFPDLASMKYASRQLLLRGTLAAVQDDPRAAIRDVRGAIKIGRHLLEDPQTISYLVSLMIHQLGFDALGSFALRFPENPIYRRELEKLLAEWQPPNLRFIYSHELIDWLSIFNESKNYKGRASVVKATRDFWAALAVPVDVRKVRVKRARRDLYDGMIASFPSESQSLKEMKHGEELDLYDIYTARIMTYKVLLRALKQNPIPRTMKITDLRSPFDKKPVTYRYDGNEMIITVSNSGESGKDVRLRLGKPKKP